MIVIIVSYAPLHKSPDSCSPERALRSKYIVYLFWPRPLIEVSKRRLHVVLEVLDLKDCSLLLALSTKKLPNIKKTCKNKRNWNLSKILVEDVEHLGRVFFVHFEQLPQRFAAELDVARSARLEGIVGPLHHLHVPNQNKGVSQWAKNRVFVIFLRWNRWTSWRPCPQQAPLKQWWNLEFRTLLDTSIRVISAEAWLVK